MYLQIQLNPYVISAGFFRTWYIEHKIDMEMKGTQNSQNNL